ncbi:hypothetical protein [Bacteroides caecimuris]|uniref:hypothetical protein n=1 Tax=Bacteroides caecimuris TaxID=1796613 RepID=UPI002570F75C|nr:hypothetical protein [Bacteroides caecimuris]
MIISGFFPSKNGDRRYGHNELNKPLLSLISDGVIPNRGDALQVMSNNDDTIRIMSGVAHCYGHWMENIGVEVITVPQSDYVYDRIDRVVIRCDETEDVRDMYIYIKQGRAQTNPVAPALERTDTIKEMCLAEIYVKKQTNQIKQSNIIDTRANTNICGWVVALIDKVDTSTLYLQWKKAYEDYYAKTQAAIDGWFANIKENLNGIGVLREYRKKIDIDMNVTDTFIIDIPMFNNELDILNVYINGILLNESEYSVSEFPQLKRYAVTLNSEVSSTQGDVIEFVILRSIDDIDADIVHRFETELMEQKEQAQNLIERGNDAIDHITETDRTVSEHEDERTHGELYRQQQEDNRQRSEITRIRNESNREAKESDRQANEDIRKEHETLREDQERERQTDTSAAIERATTAAERCEEFVDDLDRKVNVSDIDATLSATSTNPIQNKAVYEALQNIDVSGGGGISTLKRIWEGNTLSGITIKIDPSWYYYTFNRNLKVLTLAINIHRTPQGAVYESPKMVFVNIYRDSSGGYGGITYSLGNGGVVASCVFETLWGFDGSRFNSIDVGLVCIIYNSSGSEVLDLRTVESGDCYQAYISDVFVILPNCEEV